MAGCVPVFALAFIIRLVVVAFGAWQDANFKVKYTDVDYFVFTDAAESMYQGGSPYDRHTYRYTPLLSLILQCNCYIHPVAGKILFLVTDLVVGALLYIMLRQELPVKEDQHKTALKYTSLFLFNPIIINVSTRGNADCLVVFLVVLTLFLMVQRKYTMAALVHAISVHTKLYPVIFSLAFVLAINSHLPKRPFLGLFSWPAIKFGLISASTFFLSVGVCYHFYGWTFLYETYLYHFIRTDNRHNLSVYFYDIYLSLSADSKPSLALKLLAFVPQLALVVVTSIRTYVHLGWCVFLLTWLFVAFNKVCTVQYFVWYLALLPLVLPCCHLTWGAIVRTLVAWALPLASWFWFAYQLEFMGQNTFLEIWISGLLFFVGNIWALVELVRAYTPPIKEKAY